MLNSNFLRVLVLLVILLLKANYSYARPIISAISTNEINIDSNFNGQKILLFGARGDVGDIAVVIRGPKRDYIVNKKSEVLGIWHNKKRIRFDDVYSYYAFFATSDDLHNKKLLKKLQIGKENIDIESSKQQDVLAESGFRLQLIDKLSENDLYLENFEEINFLDETLFKVMLEFPKNITRGDYLVEIYLIDDGNLTAFQSIPIYVYQVGFSAKVNDMAHNNPFQYALIVIFLAVFSGFIANSIFNKLFK
jgi:uncharacterized protein (TIGR02186 family)